MTAKDVLTVQGVIWCQGHPAPTTHDPHVDINSTLEDRPLNSSSPCLLFPLFNSLPILYILVHTSRPIHNIPGASGMSWERRWAIRRMRISEANTFGQLPNAIQCWTKRTFRFRPDPPVIYPRQCQRSIVWSHLCLGPFCGMTEAGNLTIGCTPCCPVPNKNFDDQVSNRDFLHLQAEEVLDQIILISSFESFGRSISQTLLLGRGTMSVQICGRNLSRTILLS